MSFRQIYWRIKNIIRQQLAGQGKQTLPYYPSSVVIKQRAVRFGYPLRDVDARSSIAKADTLCLGQFTFLNQSLVFNDGLPTWLASPDGDRLWTYNLHYFEFAYDLLWAYQATGQVVYIQYLGVLIEDWIDNCPLGMTIAWNPYTLSRRLIVWLNLLGHVEGDPHFGVSQDRFVSSLCQQVRFLAHNLEYDIDNNHLISNARALVWAGLCLAGHDSADGWFAKGMYLLTQEAARQVLHDGGHWERSTSYHIVVLQDFLETALLLKHVGRAIPEVLDHAILRMFQYLSSLIKPDGNLPLLNDSVEGYPLIPADILAAGAVYLQSSQLKTLVTQQPSLYFDWLFGPTSRQFLESLSTSEVPSRSVGLKESGYFVMRAKNNASEFYMIVDCGEIGPNHSAAHAHADTLSFELAGFGQTRIVDPGTYEYKAGIWRDYFRSTRAHSTVTVDELDQSVFWGSFRVAEMARPRLLRWEENNETILFEGEHDGYRRLPSPVVHRRRIQYNPPAQWQITDTLESDGRSAHAYTLRFHLAPFKCAHKVYPDQCTIEFLDGVFLTLLTDHPVGTVMSFEDGWHSRTWKKKVTSSVASYTLSVTAPKVVFYTTLTLSSGPGLQTQ